MIRPMRPYFILASLVLATLATLQRGASGEPVTITLPGETVMLRDGPGVETAMANCMTCHSADYIAYQPPMARKFWEAEVKKMRDKYGAPIAEDATPALVEYLTATYGAPSAKH